MILKRVMNGIQCLAVAIAVFLVSMSTLAAQTSTLRVFVDQSKAIQIKNLKRVSVTNPRVADVVIVSPHELIVNGLKIGRTTLYLWDEKGRKEVQIVVLKDRADIPSMMRKDIKKLLDVDTVDIRIIQMDDKEALVLRGVVENDGQIDIIEELAKAYFEGKIMNLLEAKVDFISVEEQLRSLIKQSEVDISVIYEGRSVIRRGDIPPVASIILEGFVDDQYDKERILAICGAFVDSPDKIKDLIDVVNPVQVLIEGHILEMSRDEGENMGIEWGTAENTTYDDGILTMGERANNSARFLENLYTSYHGDVQYLGPRVDESHNWPWNFDNLNRVDPLYAKINFDLQKNRSKVLAAPKVITRVGSEANVRVGGEIPVFGESQSGGVAVEYKPYGLEMKIAPDVDHKGNITSKVDIVWTTIDATSAQTYGNFTYYGLRERSTSSVVTVRDGQHIIISGLISTEESKVFSGIPVLSKIPILGKLFSSTEFQESKSELVIVVTPSLLASKKMRQRYKQFSNSELATEEIKSEEVNLPALDEIGEGKIQQLQVAMGKVNDTFDKILNRSDLTITPVDLPPVTILPQSEVDGMGAAMAAAGTNENTQINKVSAPPLTDELKPAQVHKSDRSPEDFARMVRERLRSSKAPATNGLDVSKRAEIEKELRAKTSPNGYSVAPMPEEAKSLFPETQEGYSLESRLKSIITEIPPVSDGASVTDDVQLGTVPVTLPEKHFSPAPTVKASASRPIPVADVESSIDDKVDSLFDKIKSKLSSGGA